MLLLRGVKNAVLDVSLGCSFALGRDLHVLALHAAIPISITSALQNTVSSQDEVLLVAQVKRVLGRAGGKHLLAAVRLTSNLGEVRHCRKGAFLTRAPVQLACLQRL